jgi:hypothetical protein
VLQQAVAAGDGELDNAAIIREIERRLRSAPVPVPSPSLTPPGD